MAVRSYSSAPLVAIILLLIICTFPSSAFSVARTRQRDRPETGSDDDEDNRIRGNYFGPNASSYFYRRSVRTSSDQRIAELEALMTLVNGRVSVAHGKLDPFLYGKRKRTSTEKGKEKEEEEEEEDILVDNKIPTYLQMNHEKKIYKTLIDMMMSSN